MPNQWNLEDHKHLSIHLSIDLYSLVREVHILLVFPLLRICAVIGQYDSSGQKTASWGASNQVEDLSHRDFPSRSWTHINIGSIDILSAVQRCSVVIGKALHVLHYLSS